MGHHIIKASRKRILLAIYIDYLLFSSLWALLVYFLLSEYNLQFWVKYIAFATFESMLYTFIGSPGYKFLSVSKTAEVNPSIYNRENWLTISIGIFLILEGCKQLVRWTQFIVPLPFFGFTPDLPTQIVINVCFGLLCIVTGYLFLKLKPWGLILGICYSFSTIASSILSWDLWDKAIIKMVEARRDYQGIPVREGEIAFMQRLFPESIVIIASISIIGMLFTIKRFKSQKITSTDY